MNAISNVSYMNGNHTPNASRPSQVTLGLGQNQLAWLRRNMDSFRHAEEQRYQARQDTVRAARIAGLI